MEPADRAELAAFLRHRREGLRPADVGLPTGFRRRTPGLRRQEVAELAGMSVDYYVRLEQERGPRPSREMLAAISLVERLDDTPVLVCNARYDVLAWNRLAAALLGDFAGLPASERNIIWRFFTDPAARARHDPAGATQFARESVADLRAARARHPDDGALGSLIDRLRAASTEFGELWARREVGVRRSTCKRLHHPAVGWLTLDCDALHDPERDHWIILYTAAPGTPDHDALLRLNVTGPG